MGYKVKISITFEFKDKILWFENLIFRFSHKYNDKKNRVVLNLDDELEILQFLFSTLNILVIGLAKNYFAFYFSKITILQVKLE